MYLEMKIHEPHLWHGKCEVNFSHEKNIWYVWIAKQTDSNCALIQVCTQTCLVRIRYGSYACALRPQAKLFS